MKTTFAFPGSRLAAALALGLASATALAQAPDQVERRVQSVATLIETSSAARQIDSSGVAAAREKRDNARLMHREAAAALRAGDASMASELLDQAAREMMLGVRLAKPEQVAEEKAKRDFDSRMESARALAAAQRRITQEKAAGAQAQQASLSIERQIGEAQKLAAQNRYEEARPVLDRAYLTARVSIEAMRRGDTLVRSLQFASKREEYDYEIDRNDTHRMLINMLLSDRKDASGLMPSGMQTFVDKAQALRGQAEASAQGGDHAGAIKLLEDSTRELVRAIRSGGVDIPG